MYERLPPALDTCRSHKVRRRVASKDGRCGHGTECRTGSWVNSTITAAVSGVADGWGDHFVGVWVSNHHAVVYPETDNKNKSIHLGRTV